MEDKEFLEDAGRMGADPYAAVGSTGSRVRPGGAKMFARQAFCVGQPDDRLLPLD